MQQLSTFTVNTVYVCKRFDNKFEKKRNRVAVADVDANADNSTMHSLCCTVQQKWKMAEQKSGKRLSRSVAMIARKKIKNKSSRLKANDVRCAARSSDNSTKLLRTIDDNGVLCCSFCTIPFINLYMRDVLPIETFLLLSSFVSPLLFRTKVVEFKSTAQIQCDAIWEQRKMNGVTIVKDNYDALKWIWWYLHCKRIYRFNFWVYSHWDCKN